VTTPGCVGQGGLGICHACHGALRGACQAALRDGGDAGRVLKGAGGVGSAGTRSGIRVAGRLGRRKSDLSRVNHAC